MAKPKRPSEDKFCEKCHRKKCCGTSFKRAGTADGWSAWCDACKLAFKAQPRRAHTNSTASNRNQ
jgi:hypothetical protein